jgi:hypothetical protein
MIQREKLLVKLRLLQEKGQLAKSQCGRYFVNFLRPLLAANVVLEERSGSGRRVVVADRSILQAFIDQNFHDIESSERFSQRIVGVQRFRDSKAFASNNPELVHVRAWQRNILFRNDSVVDAVAKTDLHSVFSFQVGPLYTLRDCCALIEGPVMFSSFERLGLDVPLVIYGQGRLSKRLLHWLANQEDANFSVLHLPDYDPVGLHDFERLRGSLGSRVRLHIPLNLEELFAKYSKRQLLEKRKSQVLLSKVRRSDSPDVQKVIGLIDKHNAGLEQEALLIQNHLAISSA